ncbi:hypothetical protein FACS1894187_17660 [Synergistales bacterium]|nr:hypothetical protein FACS1894187_17660 [Synergistales bacterium]
MNSFTRKAFFRVFAFFAVVLALPIADAFASGLKYAPLNPEYLKYIEEKPQTGYVPSPIDWSRLKKKPKAGGASARMQATLPARFDLSAQGKTPPVLDQRDWGTCWAFAATEAMESNLLMQGHERTPLSEFHLAYFTYSYDDVNKLPGFTRNASWRDNVNLNPVFDNGGYPQQSVAMLARGTGPVLEADAPYPEEVNEDGYDWINYLPPAPYAASQYRLKEASYHIDPDDLKNTLMKNGALDVAFYVYDDQPLVDGRNYYYPFPIYGNHAVLLVGWDDDYPANKFNYAGKVPEGPGAWKIQNSWGTAYPDGQPIGDNGYFYISYYDKSFLDQAKTPALSLVLEPIEYDGIYSHDPLGQCQIIKGNGLTELLTANAFEAERDEKIVSVSFITANEDMDYEIAVYKDIPDGKAPDAGAKAHSQSGKADTVGYHSIKLTSPVQVKKGERFAIVIKMGTTDGSEAGLPVETMLPQYSDDAAVAPAQSYVFFEGAWRDAYGLVMDDADDAYSARNFNVCVKAFTVASSAGSGSSGGGCSVGAALPLLLAAVGLFGLKIKKR